MRDLPRELVAEIERQSSRPVGSECSALVDALRTRFGSSLAGVLLYGSSLHADDFGEGLVDLYAVVDRYSAAYGGVALRLGNALLAPNVFYLETAAEAPLRAKYAVMSTAHFERGCARWFHPYVWGRFAQPARLVYTRDGAARGRIHRALARAVVRFLGESALVSGPGAVRAADVWAAGLARSYAAELRTEKNREQTLTAVNERDFVALTERAAPALEPLLLPTGDGRYLCGGTRGQRRWARARWRLRRWQGRVLSILRLMKAAFTFDRGADYLAWKIERHTGVTVHVTPTLRDHPILLGPKFLWQLLRKGTVR